MKTPHAIDGPAAQGRIVYIRPVDVADLPEEVRARTGELTELYALHDENGDRLALVRNEKLAFMLARQNDMRPVHVH